MTCIFCYDIASPHRRVRVAKVLEQYGDRIQKSVFQLDVSPVKAKEIKDALLTIMAEKEDSLLILPICKTCFENTVSAGIGSLLKYEAFEIL